MPTHHGVEEPVTGTFPNETLELLHKRGSYMHANHLLSAQFCILQFSHRDPPLRVSWRWLFFLPLLF